jgi:hypothetical protein
VSDSLTSAFMVAFVAGQLTSDGGLVWLAQADDHLGLLAGCAAQIRDRRRGPVHHPLALLVRQRRPRHLPVMRLPIGQAPKRPQQGQQHEGSLGIDPRRSTRSSG